MPLIAVHPPRVTRRGVSRPPEYLVAITYGFPLGVTTTTVPSQATPYEGGAVAATLALLRNRGYAQAYAVQPIEGPEDSEPNIPEMDYRVIAVTLDRVSETAASMVARLVADGFTEPQARAITAGVYASLMDDDRDDDTQEG